MNEHRSTTGRPGISLPHQEGDIGDFLKVFACTAVMVQPLLAQLVRLSTGPTQLGLAILDNLVKYTAPAFIFGILYTTIRTHSGAGVFNYRHYLRQQWAALFGPPYTGPAPTYFYYPSSNKSNTTIIGPVSPGNS